ncbi:putative membrane protein/domain [Paramagnetospirillum magnetotacticum MS-1]|uniref:Putative membrane protein/domain n=1 Tax=Paramagnetospirillum magnetotacticum MS-1 TaxID=272627 RepID=A0A0C2YH20_PARME|nr:RDD family protein [Paramagnetospirillum magnetotacticum]KIL99019.1 putative membrane protein/domain [Paramagnetospirillum magnetotacticum MS-1]
MAMPPSAFSRIIDNTPEWDDPWGQPRYYMGITARRIYAYCIDLVVVGLLMGMVFMGSIILGALTLGLLWPVLMLVMALTPIAYHTLTIAGPRAATLGMRAANIRVMSVGTNAFDDNGRPSLLQAAIQTVCFYASVALTCWLILAVALFNPRRRTVHDMLARTVVVNDPAQWGS